MTFFFFFSSRSHLSLSKIPISSQSVKQKSDRQVESKIKWNVTKKAKEKEWKKEVNEKKYDKWN